MHAVFDRGDDAEISAAAAQAPQEVRVLLFRRAQEVAVRGDDVEGERIVAGEAEAPAEPAEAAAEREARGAGVRDDARGGRKSKRGAFMVELPEQGPAVHIGARRFRFDAHALHGLQVDDESAIAGRLARNAVAAGADRGEQLVLAREVDGAPHVGRPRATGDQRGLLVEHPVPHAAARVIGRIALEQEVALQARGEFLDRGSRAA